MFEFHFIKRWFLMGANVNKKEAPAKKKQVPDNH